MWSSSAYSLYSTASSSRSDTSGFCTAICTPRGAVSIGGTPVRRRAATWGYPEEAGGVGSHLLLDPVLLRHDGFIVGQAVHTFGGGIFGFRGSPI